MNYRIVKLREYLMDVLQVLTKGKHPINADMLPNNTDYYSLDKIPTASVVSTWVTGEEIHKDVYSFRSRREYSQDTINNLNNIGFFEQFESLIKSNNRNGILPDIDGIQEIECLNSGTLNYADTQTAEFTIQIQITYKYNEREGVSL